MTSRDHPYRLHFMKVILFHPRGYDNSTGEVSITRYANHMAPIGILSIGAVLRQKGHDVSIYDAGMQWKVLNSQWVDRIVREKPDYIGFSVTTYGFYDAYGIAEQIKDRDNRIQTVFGGVHASWGKARLMEDFPAIDYLIAGEGEMAFSDLISGKEKKNIEGLFFRDNEGVKSGPPRTTLLEMDDLPFPAYDLLEGFPKKFPLPLFSYSKYPGATVISSRGCVYQCEYCDRSVFERTFRWNSPEYTVEHIKKLHKDFGIKHVNFYDDLFTLNRKRVAKLCGLLRKENMDLAYNCIVRVGHIDEDLIHELKSSGCWMVNVGIESGDQDILNAEKEGLSLDDIRRDIWKVHNSGLWVKGLFMMGFPEETEQSINRTREFALSLPLKDANLTAYTPFPGAPIYNRINELGTFDDDWRKMDCLEFIFVPHAFENKEILERYYSRFIHDFYNRPFMRKVWRKMLIQSPHSYGRLIKNAFRFISHARKNYSGK